MHPTKRFAPIAAVALAIATLTLIGCPKTDDNTADKPVPSPPTAPEPSPPPAPAAKETVVLASGTLKLAPGAKPVGKMVFVSLRAVDGRGPPIAAMRLPVGPFPQAFAITDANVVAMGGNKRPVPDTFLLKATVDADGNPMVKSPNDLVAEVTVDKGAKALELALAPAGG
jgi:hypothetical protein